MPIFNSDLGFVPLPPSQTPETSTNPVDIVSLSGGVAGAYNDLVELPLSSNGIESGTNTANTFIDEIFTTIEDVSNIIHLPVPDDVKKIYGVTQYVEGVISDPLNEAKRLTSQALFSLFDPDKNGGNEGMLPRFQGDNWTVSEERKKEISKSGKDGFSIAKPKDANTYDILLNNPNTDTNNKDVTGNEETENQFQYKKGDQEPLPEFQFNGRDTIKNLTMRLTHLWDMSITPFDYKDIPNLAVPPMDINENYALDINKSPYYGNALKVNPEKLNVNTSNYIPILSYDMDVKTLVNKEVELFSGSSIAVPEIIRYTSHLSLQILDDENKRWRRWFQTYSENLYNEETSVVTPYKNSCLKINIYQYRSDRKILSSHEMLVTLKNYQMISTGTGEGNADIIDAEFSIVGEIEVPENEKYLNVI
jgi:hypothetical protein